MMSIETIIERLTGFFSWLYYKQWETWELLAIAIAASVILLLIVRAHLKVAANEKRLRERSPIVGVRMAEHGRRHY
jgi:hypothetical protein